MRTIGLFKAILGFFVFFLFSMVVAKQTNASGRELRETFWVEHYLLEKKKDPVSFMRDLVAFNEALYPNHKWDPRNGNFSEPQRMYESYNRLQRVKNYFGGPFAGGLGINTPFVSAGLDLKWVGQNLAETFLAYAHTEEEIIKKAKLLVQNDRQVRALGRVLYKASLGLNDDLPKLDKLAYLTEDLPLQPSASPTEFIKFEGGSSVILYKNLLGDLNQFDGKYVGEDSEVLFNKFAAQLKKVKLKFANSGQQGPLQTTQPELDGILTWLSSTDNRLSSAKGLLGDFSLSDDLGIDVLPENDVDWHSVRAVSVHLKSIAKYVSEEQRPTFVFAAQMLDVTYYINAIDNLPSEAGLFATAEPILGLVSSMFGLIGSLTSQAPDNSELIRVVEDLRRGQSLILSQIHETRQDIIDVRFIVSLVSQRISNEIGELRGDIAYLSRVVIELRDDINNLDWLTKQLAEDKSLSTAHTAHRQLRLLIDNGTEIDLSTDPANSAAASLQVFALDFPSNAAFFNVPVDTPTAYTQYSSDERLLFLFRTFAGFLERLEEEGEPINRYRDSFKFPKLEAFCSDLQKVVASAPSGSIELGNQCGSLLRQRGNPLKQSSIEVSSTAVEIWADLLLGAGLELSPSVPIVEMRQQFTYNYRLWALADKYIHPIMAMLHFEVKRFHSLLGASIDSKQAEIFGNQTDITPQLERKLWASSGQRIGNEDILIALIIGRKAEELVRQAFACYPAHHANYQSTCDPDLEISIQRFTKLVGDDWVSNRLSDLDYCYDGKTRSIRSECANNLDGFVSALKTDNAREKTLELLNCRSQPNEESTSRCTDQYTELTRHVDEYDPAKKVLDLYDCFLADKTTGHSACGLGDISDDLNLLSHLGIIESRDEMVIGFIEHDSERSVREQTGYLSIDGQPRSGTPHRTDCAIVTGGYEFSDQILTRYKELIDTLPQQYRRYVIDVRSVCKRYPGYVPLVSRETGAADIDEIDRIRAFGKLFWSCGDLPWASCRDQRDHEMDLQFETIFNRFFNDESLHGYFRMTDKVHEDTITDNYGRPQRNVSTKVATSLRKGEFSRSEKNSAHQKNLNNADELVRKIIEYEVTRIRSELLSGANISMSAAQIQSDKRDNSQDLYAQLERVLASWTSVLTMRSRLDVEGLDKLDSWLRNHFTTSDVDGGIVTLPEAILEVKERNGSMEVLDVFLSEASVGIEYWPSLVLHTQPSSEFWELARMLEFIENLLGAYKTIAEASDLTTDHN